MLTLRVPTSVVVAADSLACAQVHQHICSHKPHLIHRWRQGRAALQVRQQSCACIVLFRNMQHPATVSFPSSPLVLHKPFFHSQHFSCLPCSGVCSCVVVKGSSPASTSLLAVCCCQCHGHVQPQQPCVNIADCMLLYAVVNATGATLSRSSQRRHTWSQPT